MMRLLVDARLISATGIGRYIREMLVSLQAVRQDIALCLAGEPIELTHFCSHASLAAKIIPYTAAIYSVREQIAGCRFFWRRRYSADVFFFPHYNLPRYVPARSVVTIHDLTHFDFPDFFGQARVAAARLILRNTLRKATKLVAVSEATAQKLVSFCPESACKLRVIHNGVSGRFSPCPLEERENTRRKLGLPRFILYVGNYKPHKNVHRLLEAFAYAAQGLPEVHLVLIGTGGAAAQCAENLSCLTKLREEAQVEDERLLAYYRAAECLIIPSLSEGFGLPALEAMAVGTPVLAADIPALREICADGALYFDPLDTRQMWQRICEVFAGPSLRHTLSERGLRQASFFNWQRAANLLWECLLEAAAESGSHRARS